MPFFLVIRQYVKKYLAGGVKLTLVLFLILLILGTFGGYFTERNANPGFQNLWESFWWALVTIATVGYGDKVPITIAGRIIGIFCLLGGPVLLASVLGSLGLAWYDRWTKGERGMNQVKSKDHLVICGWNEKASKIIQEVRASRDLKHLPIVIIDCRIETKPLGDPDLFFVRGNASEIGTLQQANIVEAKYAIVLSESNTPESDQKTVLTVLAIEKSNPSIISSAELNDSNNSSHLQHAGCDIIVNSADMTSKLLAISLLNSSVTRVVTDLISGEGNELYRCPVPARYIGRKFGELISVCKKEHDIIAIGIERDGECVLNPPVEKETAQGDYLLVIAPEPPDLG